MSKEYIVYGKDGLPMCVGTAKECCQCMKVTGGTFRKLFTRTKYKRTKTDKCIKVYVIR